MKPCSLANHTLENPMRSLLITAVASLIPLAVHAECKDEVLTSLEKQRRSPAFRMETSMISEQGPVNMTVEYVPPGRMHQTVKLATEDKPSETIIIGLRAWSKADGAWEEMPEETSKMMSAQLNELLGDEPGTIGTVACLGSTAVDGRDLIVYRIENDAQSGPKDISPGAKEKAAAALADEGRPLRMFYVDPANGLPVRSLFARANKLDKPIFKANYSYPADIKIEAPAGK